MNEQHETADDAVAERVVWTGVSNPKRTRV